MSGGRWAWESGRLSRLRPERARYVQATGATRDGDDGPGPTLGSPAEANRGASDLAQRAGATGRAVGVPLGFRGSEPPDRRLLACRRAAGSARLERDDPARVGRSAGRAGALA